MLSLHAFVGGRESGARFIKLGDGSGNFSSGNVVQLGEFGNFRMSINSEGTNTPEDFDATKIKGARIIFFPGSALRTTRNEVNFEPLEVTKKSAGSDSESPDEI